MLQQMFTAKRLLEYRGMVMPCLSKSIRHHLLDL